MEKQGAKTVVPKLRFPEFRASAEWEVHELQSIAHLAKGVQLSSSLKDDAAKFPHFNGGVTYSSRTGRANRDANTTIISEGGNSCGYVQFVDEPFWCGGHCYSIVPKRPDQNRYLFYVLQARQKEIMGLRVGSGLPNIPKNVLEKFEVAFAKDSFEQQKIADCLTSLDEVIAAQGRKVEALKAHKRGLIQQLFPREGETRPRLRFPEFRDAPDLEAKVLSELVKFSSGGTPSKAAPNYWGGDIPWISASSMHDMIIEDADQRVTKEAIGNGTRLARKGCILVLVRGSMLFKRVPICISTRDVAFNQDVKALAVLPDMVAMFLLYQLVAMSPRIPINETGIGAGKIETEVLENLEIWVPGIAEQQRIADCLSSLDTQITAETQQLIALKIHKQGLMQQLFPVPEAAGA